VAVSVIVPKLAADEAGAMLTEWYCQEGEQVVAGQPLCRLERDFVACEVEAEEGGVLSHAVGVGDAPAPGDVLAYLAPPADGSVRAAEGQPATLASSEAPRPPAAPEPEPEPEPDAAAGAWLSSGTSDGEAGFVWPSEREAESPPEADGDRWGVTEEQFVAEETAFWPNTEAEREAAPEGAAVEFEVQATEPAWGADAAAEDGAAKDQPAPFAWDDAGEVDDAPPEAKPAEIASMPAPNPAIEEPPWQIAAADGAAEDPTSPFAWDDAWDDAGEVDDASPETKPAAIASMPAPDLATEEPARQIAAVDGASWPNTEAEPEEAPEAAAAEFETPAAEPAWGADPAAEDGAAEDQPSPFAWDDAGEFDDASPETKPAAIASMPAPDLATEEPARQVAAEAAAGSGAEREPAEPLPPQPITLRIEIEATEDRSAMTDLIFEAIVVAAAEHVDASACIVRDMRAGATQPATPATNEWAVLASYEGTGVVEATSRLEAGKPFSFALADRRSAPAFHEHGLSARHTMALALAYDGAWWSDEEGLRLLAEVGESLARPTAEAA